MLTEEQRKLITANYPLLLSYYKKLKDSGTVPVFLQPELLSNLHLGFCISAMKYDEDYGCKFSTYVYGGFDYWKDSFFQQYVKELKEKQLQSEESQVEIRKKVDERKYVRVDDVYDFLNKSELSFREKVIVMDYYFEGLTLQEVGRKYGVHGATISSVLRKALKKLKRVMDRKGLTMEDFYKF